MLTRKCCACPAAKELFAQQVYSQEIQEQVRRACALQAAAMQSLQRRLANAEPMRCATCKRQLTRSISSTNLVRPLG